MYFSLSLSRADVASSKIRIGAFFKNGAGNRDPLPFSARKHYAAFADFALVTFRQAHNKS